MIGTKILEKLFYILYKKKIFDIQSGLRVFDTKIKKKKFIGSLQGSDTILQTLKLHVTQ